MGFEHRLRRLEDERRRREPEDEAAAARERERRRAEARHMAECFNRDRRRAGLTDFFVITADGEVFTADGRPVADGHQALSEGFYRQYLEWGFADRCPGLVHDEERESLYTPDGELALSRTFVNLEHLFRALG